MPFDKLILVPEKETQATSTQAVEIYQRKKVESKAVLLQAL
jgi:hypothetical protein